MEAQPKRCRRCLLQDMADENDYYASVVRYRATMPRRVRTPDAEYTARLEHCRILQFTHRSHRQFRMYRSLILQTVSISKPENAVSVPKSAQQVQ